MMYSHKFYLYSNPSRILINKVYSFFLLIRTLDHLTNDNFRLCSMNHFMIRVKEQDELIKFKRSARIELRILFTCSSIAWKERLFFHDKE